MSKKFTKLLVATLATCATTVAGVVGVDTNLSQINFRDYYSAPYSMTGGASSMMMENGQREEAFGGCFSVMGFWEQSINGSRGSQELAKGYGVSMSNTFDVKAYAGLPGTAKTPIDKQVDARRLFHDYNNTGNDVLEWPNANVALEAKHRRFGVNFEYSQCLSQFYEGLKFRISTAAVGMRNELVQTYTKDAIGVGNVAGEESAGISVKKFLQGDHAATTNGVDTGNAQAPLKYGKFAAEEQTEYALNDVQACLGMELVSTDNAAVCLGISAVIPTGREMNAAHVMEPQAGQRHFKLGAEMDMRACLAEGPDYKAAFSCRGIWHYAFKREGVMLPSHLKEHYGQYYLGFKKGSTLTSALEPLLNLVPHTADIKPGNIFDLSSILSFEKGCLAVEAGYNFHYAQEQKNDVVGWTKDSIAMVTSDFAGETDPRDATTARADWVKDTDLSWNVASQVNHHIFASVGFVGKDWSYPASVNVVGGYQFAHNRSRTPEAWSVAVKGCVCF